VELQTIESIKTYKGTNTFCIMGFECDEGVRRNKGRIGAAEAPKEIRRYLASIPYHFNENVKIIDTGNTVCEGTNLEAAQKELGHYIKTILQASAFPVILGGGHETLYGHYLGVRSYLGDSVSLGIINIDAHFDMRNDSLPSSGTMFKQILEEDQNTSYLVLGIQKYGNTKRLFNTAEKYNCIYILEEDIENYPKTFQVIDHFCKKHDAIIFTLCTDAICSDAAPGVSAPSPFGLNKKVVRNLIKYISKKTNLLSFDISEVNPLLDQDGKTSRLAAYLIAELISNRQNIVSA
jgi:formiminoglutamase